MVTKVKKAVKKTIKPAIKKVTKVAKKTAKPAIKKVTKVAKKTVKLVKKAAVKTTKKPAAKKKASAKKTMSGCGTSSCGPSYSSMGGGSSQMDMQSCRRGACSPTTKVKDFLKKLFS